jgi:uncharacterized membrane protein (DUF373 family)
MRQRRDSGSFSGGSHGRDGQIKQLKERWEVLSYYQRFESAVALVLTLVTGLVIVIALYRLATTVIAGLLFGALDPLDYEVFQAVFGEIMTLLIALEFNHTLQYVGREQSIIQTKVVLLIALLAIARKFIILDLQEVDAGQLLGLAAIALVLAAAYWLIREHDARLARAKDPA